MKQSIVVLVLVLVGVFAYAVAERISSDALGMAVGMLFGVLAGIPSALLVLASSRRPADDDRRQPQQPPPYQPRLPPTEPWPYQPPVIVLAAPREHSAVMTVEQPSGSAYRLVGAEPPPVAPAQPVVRRTQQRIRYEIDSIDGQEVW